MSDIDPYVRVLFLKETPALAVPLAHARKEEFIPPLNKHLSEVLSRHGARENITDVDALTHELFHELFVAGAFAREEHGFAGAYYIYSKSKYGVFRTKFLEGSEISKAADRVGARYFRDQFAGYMEQRNPEDTELATRGEIALPASDRVVFIGDNGPEVIDDIELLREALRTHNDEDGKLLDRRDRIDSELSAGQELLKSKFVRIRPVMTVLVSTLSFIAVEFAGGAIGELAAKLLEQLGPLLGL